MRARGCKDCDDKRERAKQTPTGRAAPKCDDCGRRMRRGVALQSVFGRIDGRPVQDGDTISATGAAGLVPCWKCPECGRSIKR